ncbi:MAG: FkbM family methyltransferase [Candidatus Latescibacterota bacterium]
MPHSSAGIEQSLKGAAERLLPRKLVFAAERGFYAAIHERELKLLRRLCDPCRVSVDVGANKGVYTLFLVRTSSWVVYFEPNPPRAAYLEHKFRGTNVTVHCCALGRAAAELDLRIPCAGGKELDGWASFTARFDDLVWKGSRITRVDSVSTQVRRLDDFGLGNVGFVKIDVEGFETAVLEGAARTIAESRPNLLVEVEECLNPAMWETFRLVQSWGYQGHFLLGGRLRPLAEFSPPTMQSRALRGDRDRYVNNFIFTPAG